MYRGLTRSKQLVVLVGQKNLAVAAKSHLSHSHYTKLLEWLAPEL